MGFCCSCESLWLAPGWRGQTSHWRVSDARFFLSDSFATLTVSRKTFYSLLFHCKPLFVLLLGKFNFRVPQGVRGPQTVKRHFWTFDGTGLWARNQNWCSLKFWTNSAAEKRTWSFSLLLLGENLCQQKKKLSMSFGFGSDSAGTMNHFFSSFDQPNQKPQHYKLQWHWQVHAEPLTVGSCWRPGRMPINSSEDDLAIYFVNLSYWQKHEIKYE